MSPQKVHLRLRVKLFVLVVHPPCSPHQMWTIIFLKSLNPLKHIWQWQCQCFCCAFPRVSTDPLVEIGASTFIAAAADMTEAAAARCTPLHSVSWSFFQACNLCGEIFSPADDNPREEWALDSLETKSLQSSTIIAANLPLELPQVQLIEAVLRTSLNCKYCRKHKVQVQLVWSNIFSCC